MKAVTLNNVKKFVVKEVKDPERKPDEVLVSVSKSGICGSDLHYWEAGQPLELIMGHEWCGNVLDPGNRKDLKKGDRVTALPISPCGHCEACLKGNPQYCLETWTNATGLSLSHSGALANKLSVRADMVMKVPETVTDIEMSLVEPAAVALHAIHLADIKIGNKVLIIGGGIIGLLTATFAKQEGASIVALSETNPARGNKAVELQAADIWLDATNPNFIENVMKETENGFDIVIDCCGNQAAITSALMTTKPGGTLVLVGVSLTPITIPMVIGVMHELTIKGAIAYTKEEFKTCIDLIATKKLEVTKFVSKVIGLEEVQAAYEELISGNSESIKIIVDPNL